MQVRRPSVVVWIHDVARRAKLRLAGLVLGNTDKRRPQHQRHDTDNQNANEPAPCAGFAFSAETAKAPSVFSAIRISLLKICVPKLTNKPWTLGVWAVTRHAYARHRINWRVAYFFLSYGGCCPWLCAMWQETQALPGKILWIELRT